MIKPKIFKHFRFLSFVLFGSILLSACSHENSITKTNGTGSNSSQSNQDKDGFLVKNNQPIGKEETAQITDKNNNSKFQNIKLTVINNNLYPGQFLLRDENNNFIFANSGLNAKLFRIENSDGIMIENLIFSPLKINDLTGDLFFRIFFESNLTEDARFHIKLRQLLDIDPKIGLIVSDKNLTTKNKNLGEQLTQWNNASTTEKRLSLLKTYLSIFKYGVNDLVYQDYYQPKINWLGEATKNQKTNSLEIKYSLQYTYENWVQPIQKHLFPSDEDLKANPKTLIIPFLK